MAVIQINIPERLWQRLQAVGRPVEEVVIEVLEDAFNENEDAVAIHERPTKKEIIQRLEETGYLMKCDNWDDPVADTWDALSQEKKRQHLQEVEENYLADSAVSRDIIQNRR